MSVLFSTTLTACPGPIPISQQTTRVFAPRTTIRVGEELRFSTEREFGPTTARGTVYGFIYSSNNSNDGPYLDDSHGNIIPDGRPELYPVSSAVEIIEPRNANNNVSPLALAQYDGRYIRTEFVIRGRQVGIATIKAGFVKDIEGIGYGRIPYYPRYDGTIQITVVE